MPEPKPTKKPAPAKPAAPQAAEAYKEVEPEILALEKDDLWTINIEIPQAVSIVLGMLPGLKELRSAIQKKLPDHDLVQFRGLRECMGPNPGQDGRDAGGDTARRAARPAAARGARRPGAWPRRGPYGDRGPARACGDSVFEGI
jgi:hypothetical protein